jgi:hypothetical protein
MRECSRNEDCGPGKECIYSFGEWFCADKEADEDDEYVDPLGSKYAATMRERAGAEGWRQWGGKKKPAKTTAKKPAKKPAKKTITERCVTYAGKKRRLYVGPHGGCYVRCNGRFVHIKQT